MAISEEEWQVKELAWKRRTMKETRYIHAYLHLHSELLETDKGKALHEELMQVIAILYSCQNVPRSVFDYAQDMIAQVIIEEHRTNVEKFAKTVQRLL